MVGIYFFSLNCKLFCICVYRITYNIMYYYAKKYDKKSVTHNNNITWICNRFLEPIHIVRLAEYYTKLQGFDKLLHRVSVGKC